MNGYSWTVSTDNHFRQIHDIDVCPMRESSDNSRLQPPGLGMALKAHRMAGRIQAGQVIAHPSATCACACRAAHVSLLAVLGHCSPSSSIIQALPTPVAVASSLLSTLCLLSFFPLPPHSLIKLPLHCPERFVEGDILRLGDILEGPEGKAVCFLRRWIPVSIIDQSRCVL